MCSETFLRLPEEKRNRFLEAAWEEFTRVSFADASINQIVRRCGIARRLVEQLMEELKQQGNYCLSLEVRASNAPAIALYEKLGFSQVGRRPKYYRNPREDALILRKEWKV